MRPLIIACLLLSTTLEAQQRRLDPTNFVVIGEGLSAGMADFGLRNIYQEKSFPAVMAEQMDVAFPQPLIQGPGIGNLPGFAELPVSLPGPDQGAVRKDFPPLLFVFNLSVPGFRVADALARRPTPPLIQQRDMQQSLTNMILGYPALILKNKPLWTQVEYARQMSPTLVVMALGYYDVLEAAATGDLSKMTDAASFRTSYTAVLKAMTDLGAEVVAVNVPDPTDTAYFTSVSAASQQVRAPGSVLQSLYRLRPDDLLTVSGLVAIANQLDANAVGTLPAGSVLSADAANQIRARVRQFNQDISSIAQQNGAVVYDLQALFSRIRASGLVVGSRVLTADYQGGFYSLDGYYPGKTGHALIANEILGLLNRTYNTRFPLASLIQTAEDDPAVRFIPTKASPSTEVTK